MVDVGGGEQQAATTPAMAMAQTRAMAAPRSSSSSSRPPHGAAMGLLLVALVLLNLNSSVHAALQPKTPNSVQSSQKSKETPELQQHSSSSGVSTSDAGEKVKKMFDDPRHNEILKQIQAKQFSLSKATKTTAPEYGKIAKSPHVAPYGHELEVEEDDIERLLKASRPSVPVWGFLPHRSSSPGTRGAADERRRQLKNELAYWQRGGGGMMADEGMGTGASGDDMGVMLGAEDEQPYTTHHSSMGMSKWSSPPAGRLNPVSAKRSPQSSHLSLGISTEFHPSDAHHSAAFVGGGGGGGYATAAGDGRRTTEDLKRSRPYDVPQIECPLADDGMERFACPTPDSVGRYRCVDDHVLCDGFIDCPNAEDEDRQACMFYKTTKAHLDVLADALLRWARGKKK